ncbi:MAG: hypothetical protein IAG13_23015 [Deltaproteobacteria bacterium]|nr:hypothetical protein [Nannocystaceae bacterium]
MNYAFPLRPYFRAIALLGAGLALGLTACSEPPPGKLFDEDGVWSLVQYDIGTGLDDLPTPRKDAFMLDFDAEQKVVTTAACTSEENSSVTPANSPCRLTPATTEWQCQCFSYAFQEEIMQWQEFPAGTAMPPKVKFDRDLVDTAGGGGGGSDEGTGSGGGDGGESGGAEGEVTVITVTELPDRADTYDFRPLPTGVFGSNNVSHFILEARAESTFNQVYDDEEERKAYCEPCVPGSE